MQRTIPRSLASGLLRLVAIAIWSLAYAAHVDARVPVVPQATSLDSTQWDELNLGRAVDLWLAGDTRGAAQLLETIDVSTTSSFQRADRAAFLLAAAYLQMGDADAFRRVARRASGENGSAYRRWIQYCDLTQFGPGGPATGSLASPDGLPGADILGASLLMETGRYDRALQLLDSGRADGPLASIRLYMLAMATEAAGQDATPQWKRLSQRRPDNRLEADLVGAALLQLATGRLVRGRDADDLLERMPRDSRFAPRAAHVRALAAQESGDADTAQRLLSEVLAAFPGYEDRREVELALGATAMERSDWDAALSYFESAETEWEDEHEILARLESEAGREDIWRAWERQAQWRGEIRLAPEAVMAELDRLVDASLDLNDDPSLSTGDRLERNLWPAPGGVNDADAGVWARHYPNLEEWDRLRGVRRRQRQAASELARQTRAVLDRKLIVENRIEYLDRGRNRAARSAAELAAAAASLDSLLARLDAELAMLVAVRDSALLEIDSRTREMGEQFRRDRLFIEALRHFHVEGPRSERPEPFPAGVPTPAELLEKEQSFASLTERFLADFAAHYDSVISRSFDEIWEPRLMGDSRQMHAAILLELARARRIGAAVDSTKAWYAADPELAAAVARRDELSGIVDSLRASERRTRSEIAAAVALRGRQQLEREREAIDYHIADASYELAVHYATDTLTAEDPTVVVPARRRAIDRLETFLSRYPETAARGESRYRLADLRLMQARDDFQAKMAEFLGQQPAAAGTFDNRALAPFVDYAPAVALYQAILEQDRDTFPHLDAVLFNLGMILSDDGRPEAADYLTRLVEQYPESPDCQEAWLRMGSDRFERKDFAGCIGMFEKAADGTDDSFTAIALYKLGWAHFEEDRFGDAVDAFRRLMDLYADNEDVAAAMDLRDEAEEYLVHSLARAGGASAFESYFDGLGGRVYEARVLMSLGHLTRSVSLYEEAAECDRLWLARYPLHPKSLDVARRLVDTYNEWNKHDAARETKQELAERFLPGSQWYQANRDDALRADGRRYAQSAYRETAAYHHRKAQESNDSAAWDAALAHYERYLGLWPGDTDSHRMHYLAGDAAAHLARYSLAADHFATAAESDSASLALDASWQRVAVTDEWYRSSRPEGVETATGDDSLATRLLAAGDAFVARFSGDERCVDIEWRQCNIAYAHGRYADAARRFELLSERHPNDPRAALAIRMSGDAHYNRQDYQSAGTAYARALALARAARQDSVIAQLEAAVPLCYYKHAESVADADDKNGEKEAAHLFELVARKWPGFEHADLALYRAGLGYAASEGYTDAVGAWESLLAGYPESEYRRDSAVQIAVVQERSGNTREAAAAYERFSRLYPDDPDASEALLKASDLLANAGDETGAERMRTLFLERFPGELETVMDIRAERAARELAAVGAGTSTLASLLGAGTASSSELDEYLRLAAAHPELASTEILAQVDFVKAEEAHPAYAQMRLTQPLPRSIEKKKQKMEELVAMYNSCARRGVPQYARASAYRIGQVLIEFGDALAGSERPPGLSEDDLIAYEDVLEEQSWEFFDRGEDAWSELLQQVGDSPEDPGGWIARTREALWPRLAWRFLYRPEVDYPLVAATPPPAPGAN